MPCIVGGVDAETRRVTRALGSTKAPGSSRPVADVDRADQRHRFAGVTDLKRLRALAAKLIEILFLMAAGALFFTWYIDWRSPAIGAEMQGYERTLSAIFWVLLIALNAIRFDGRSRAEGSEDISPRWSGAMVVLLTGLAATAYAALPSGLNNLLLSAIIFVGTLIAVIAIWRFATAHADEIGEARFKR